MKILKIELENINSLKGKWTIDFSDPSYAANRNLFAICGKTGSGKSSILDAITLAIYGQTPRQGLVYKSTNGNEVMTHGTGSCMARVTYQCSKGIFVTEWNQHRARENADGALQEAHYLVYGITNPNFNEKGKTGKNAELANVNIKNISLDYSQFCRSIMLAQGDFSKFLTCKPEERTLILEKLNGTEKYHKVAKKAGDKWSEAGKNLDLAKKQYDAAQANVLTPEQLDALNAEKGSLETNQRELTNSIKGIESFLQWYSNLETRRREWDDAKGKFNVASRAKEEFGVDSVILANGLKAKNCEVAFNQVEGLSGSIGQKNQDLKDFNETLQQKSNGMGDAKANAEACSEKLKAAEDVVNSNSALWNEVRKLDENIKNATENADSAKKVYDDCSDTVKILNDKEKTLKDNISELETKISKKEKFLNEHKVDEGIAEILSGFQQQINTAKSQQESIRREEENFVRKCDEVASLEEQTQQLQSTFSELDSYLKEHAIDENLPNVLAASKGCVDQFKTDATEISKQEKMVAECEKTRASFNDTLTNVETKIKEIEQEQLQLFNNEVIVLADVIQKHLVEGEACPVCGSKEHPSCCGTLKETSDDDSERTADAATKIRSLRDKMESARNEKDRVVRDIELNEEKSSNAAATLKTVQERYNGSVQKLSESWAPWGKSVSVETCDSVLAELQRFSDVYAGKKTQYDESVKSQTEISNKLEIAKNARDNVSESLEQQKAALSELTKEMEIVVSPWISSFRLENCESNYKLLQERSSSYAKEKSAYDELKKNLDKETINLQNNSDNQKTAKSAFDAASKKMANAADTLSTLKTQRSQKFGDQDVDFVEKTAKDNVDAARDAEKIAAKQLQDLQDAINELNTKIAQRHKDIQQETEHLEKAKRAFADALQQNGFADEAAFNDARLSAEKLEALQARKESVEREFTATESACTTTKNAYDNCLQEHPDAEPKETLESKRQELASAAEEINKRLIEIGTALSKNSSDTKELEKLRDEYEKAQAAFDHWNVLYDWFGSKMNGDGFSKFVQSLSFNSLLNLTNKHLQRIKGRYTLVAKDDLGFEIDDAQLADTRSISNLSGGEKFLVSLSLALGIAELASRNVRIESLFLDEGFGTLDGTLLQDVMESLKSLQNQGKMLGVITHMDKVKDEFDQKIQLESNDDGYSTITGPGITCGRAS